ncbi:MAG TPA: hypothetical protein V6D34_04970 [Candidatus Sericytochromatia bacterium]
MNRSMSKFAKDHALSKATVHRRCSELGIDTSEGLNEAAVAQLCSEFGIVVPVNEPEAPAIRVEVGNHAITLATPQLPTTYSLESLRSSDVVAFDDPLAIAAQFLKAADLVTAQMQQDLQTRQAAIQQTQQAKEAIDQKALELKIQSKLYREQAAMANAVHSAETQGLQQSLKALQNLGKQEG